jgi:hypothetical protein
MRAYLQAECWDSYVKLHEKQIENNRTVARRPGEGLKETLRCGKMECNDVPIWAIISYVNDIILDCLEESWFPLLACRLVRR